MTGKYLKYFPAPRRSPTLCISAGSASTRAFQRWQKSDLNPSLSSLYKPWSKRTANYASELYEATKWLDIITSRWMGEWILSWNWPFPRSLVGEIKIFPGCGSPCTWPCKNIIFANISTNSWATFEVLKKESYITSLFFGHWESYIIITLCGSMPELFKDSISSICPCNAQDFTMSIQMLHEHFFKKQISLVDHDKIMYMIL
jgi:hypothetical protein